MIDETDSRLVTLLQQDARQTVKALAEELAIAASTCLERIRSLQARGVIRGFHADVDLGAAGLTIQALVSVRLSPKKDDVVERFVNHVWEMPETISVSLLSGIDDVHVHLAVPDTEHLRRIVLRDIASFPGVVDERTALVFEHRRKHKITIPPTQRIGGRAPNRPLRGL